LAKPGESSITSPFWQTIRKTGPRRENKEQNGEVFRIRRSEAQPGRLQALISLKTEQKTATQGKWSPPAVTKPSRARTYKNHQERVGTSRKDGTMVPTKKGSLGLNIESTVSPKRCEKRKLNAGGKGQ